MEQETSHVLYINRYSSICTQPHHREAGLSWERSKMLWDESMWRSVIFIDKNIYLRWPGRFAALLVRSTLGNRRLFLNVCKDVDL